MRFTVDFATLPDEARRHFLDLPEGLGSEPFFRANEFLNGYVDRVVHEQVAVIRREPVSPLRGETIARPAHWSWMARKLERAGLAELDPWGRVATLRELDESAAQVKERALAEFPNAAASFALIDAARDGYVEFLRGTRDGASILLGPATLPIWRKYFDNSDFVYAANNRVAASLVERVLAATSTPKSASTSGERLPRPLELGGGLGSAAEAVLGRVGSAIGRYRFTEPFGFFLAGAKRKLARAFPTAAIEYAALDVNAPFAEQGVAAASHDLVLAVNVLHVARHLGRTLAQVQETLRPGGAFVLVECVRPAPGVPIYVDYPFQLLDEFFRIDDASPQRPHGGFLTARQWRRLLELAGLRVERELPDHDAVNRWYGGLHLVGMVARKGA